MISVVIPTYGKIDLLKQVLRTLENQSYTDFECIIFDDGNDPRIQDLIIPSEFNIALEIIRSDENVGPAQGRNRLAEYARSDVLLFLGADCLAHKDLVGWHAISHQYGADIVQGYTPWHPDVISVATDFIDSSGLQSAWGNLQNDDGTWLRKISPAFCLTTNYSINKQLFLNEMFNESFSGAAWEDVEFGYRLSKYGDVINTIVEPRAINYHYHRYSIDSFFRRCRMEGYHRLTLCKIHPEMAWGMVNPYELRIADKINDAEIISMAHEMDSIDLSDTNNELIPKLKEIKYQRIQEACKVFSLKGVIDRIADEHPAMQALMHVHQPQSVIAIISGVEAINNGHLGYAMHTAQWFITERPDDWSAHSYLGEVELEAGNFDEAFIAFSKSLAINPGNKWATDRLEGLRETTW